MKLHLITVAWYHYKFRSGQQLTHTMKIIKPLVVLGLACKQKIFCFIR